MEVGGDSVWFPWGGIAGSIETDGFGFFKQLDVMNGKERMRVTGTFLCDIDNGADSLFSTQPSRRVFVRN